MADVLVNAEKLERAKHIVALLTGKVAAKNFEEQERITHFGRVAQSEGIDLKKTAEAEKAFYLKLGGLVRTETEQKAHEEKVKEIKAKGKGNRLGLK